MTRTNRSAWHWNRDFGLYTRQPAPRPDRPTTASRILNLPDPLLREAVATHEAGHAVLALHLGARLTSVSVADDHGRGPGAPGPAGRVDYEPDTAEPVRSILLAGAAGERAQDRWLRQADLWTEDRAWVVEILADQDRAVIERTVRLAHPDGPTYGVSDDPAVDLAALHDHVDVWLHDLWDQVMALAAALNRRGTLTGAQAAAVIGLTVNDGTPAPGVAA
ncbi:hypothetical protein [Streptomyces sp. NRRL S-495]|uniref:hypothetical protein n=1 Tax=Streptomyces sp. NRRL S-495 TaxID=1609133 RepID=UPI0005F92477|nr:hypothetical protein [Streptomyces sp. NRRL S-495]KJY38133.1 hypothetical protein VR45_06825 [Streptomyces sp. NRRL S-495]